MTAATYLHLDPRMQGLAAEDAAARIRMIEKDLFIEHDYSKYLNSVLDEFMCGQRQTRMPCLLILGDAGMGKTAQLHRFRRQFPDSHDDTSGQLERHIIMVNVPTEPNKTSLQFALLEALGAPTVSRHRSVDQAGVIWIGQFSKKLYTDSTLDLDLSPELRATLSRWSQLCTTRIPPLANPAIVLPKSARLAFCKSCWNEDVRNGTPPYVRCSCLNWSTVHCFRHGIFLCAKKRSVEQHATYTDWQEVWACKLSWRSASQLRWHGYDLWALCYRPCRSLPECSRGLMNLLGRLANPTDKVASETLRRVLLMWRSSERGEECVNAPLLLENRIEVLVQAATLLD